MHDDPAQHPRENSSGKRGERSGSGLWRGTDLPAPLWRSDPRKAIAAIVALARVSGRDEIHRKDTDPAPDPGLRARMLAALDNVSWADLNQNDRIDLLRTYSLVFIRI